MMYWNGDWSWGAWAAMAGMMLVFWAFFAWLVVMVLREWRRSSGHTDADAILAERLARGEISREEYRELHDTLKT